MTVHYVHMTTNGILLPRLPDIVNAFKDKPVSMLLSVDGYEQSYEHVRKRSSWAKLVEAIRLLQAKRMEGNNKLAAISVNYILMKSTLDDLPRFVRFCAREGIDGIHLLYILIIQTMVNRGEITDDESVYHHKEETDLAVRLAIDVAKQEGISLFFPPPLSTPSLLGRRSLGPTDVKHPPGNRWNAQSVVCSKPWEELWIHQDGSISVCCCGPDNGPVVGAVDEGLEAAWNSNLNREVRSALLQGEMHPHCRCGANHGIAGRTMEEEHFFTRARDEKKRLQSLPLVQK